jgi:hypothetical protein
MSSHAHEGYGIVRLSGKPVIALPSASRRVRLAGASRIQGFTPKRALFRRVLRAAVVVGLDRLIAEPASSPLPASVGFDFRSWLEKASHEIGAEGASATVIWPWPPGIPRARLYVHLLASSGHPLAFSKLAFDEANSGCILAEEKMLRSLEEDTFKRMKVPKVLSSGAYQGCRYLTVEAVPVTARPARFSLSAYPAEVVTEIAGSTTTVDMKRLSSLAWWNRFLERSADVPEFLDDLTSLGDLGVRLCRVHGDFEPKNLVEDGHVFWVLDWEQGDPSGPWLTDPVRYHVLIRWRECKRRPATVLSEVLRDQGADRSPQIRLDVGLALTFLHGAGFAEATQLLHHWRCPRRN